MTTTQPQRAEDLTMLVELARRLNGRRPPKTLDPLELASRYLRRFSAGAWYRGGHHIGRMNFGCALCKPDKGPWYVDPRAGGVSVSADIMTPKQRAAARGVWRGKLTGYRYTFTLAGEPITRIRL